MRVSQFLRFQLAVWIVFSLFIFPAKLETESSLPSALASFSIHDGISIALSFGLGVIYHWVYRKHDDILWFSGAVILCSAFAAFLQVVLFWMVGDTFPSERRTIFGSSASLGIFYFRFGLFACWSLLYFTIRSQREEAERDLRMLRAQMNPHLLTCVGTCHFRTGAGSCQGRRNGPVTHELLQLFPPPPEERFRHTGRRT